jgi:arylsulfatase A-like enzyme
VQGDPQLRESTTIFLLPEFGRDKNLNQRNGLDHGDGSDDLQKVACVAYGPDFKPGKTIDSDCNSIDVCPTICKLLGVDAPLVRGRTLPRLLG